MTPMGYIGEDEELTEVTLFPDAEPGTIPDVVPQTEPVPLVTEPVPA